MVYGLLRGCVFFLGGAGVLAGLSLSAYQIGTSVCDPAQPSEWCQRAEWLFNAALVAVGVAALCGVGVIVRLVHLWWTAVRFDPRRTWYLYYFVEARTIRLHGGEAAQHRHVEGHGRSEATIYVRGVKWAVLTADNARGQFEEQRPHLHGVAPNNGEQVSVHIAAYAGWRGRKVSIDVFPKVDRRDPPSEVVAT